MRVQVTPKVGEVWRSVDPPHRFVLIDNPFSNPGRILVRRVNEKGEMIHVTGQADYWYVRAAAFRGKAVSRHYILHNPRKEAALVGNAP